MGRPTEKKKRARKPKKKRKGRIERKVQQNCIVTGCNSQGVNSVRISLFRGFGLNIVAKNGRIPICDSHYSELKEMRVKQRGERRRELKSRRKLLFEKRKIEIAKLRDELLASGKLLDIPEGRRKEGAYRKEKASKIKSRFKIKTEKIFNADGENLVQNRPVIKKTKSVRRKSYPKYLRYEMKVGDPIHICRAWRKYVERSDDKISIKQRWTEYPERLRQSLILIVRQVGNFPLRHLSIHHCPDSTINSVDGSEKNTTRQINNSQESFDFTREIKETTLVGIDGSDSGFISLKLSISGDFECTKCDEIIVPFSRWNEFAFSSHVPTDSLHSRTTKGTERLPRKCYGIHPHCSICGQCHTNRLSHNNGHPRTRW